MGGGKRAADHAHILHSEKKEREAEFCNTHTKSPLPILVIRLLLIFLISSHLNTRKVFFCIIAKFT